MVSTSSAANDGRLYYFDPVTDPTPSTNDHHAPFHDDRACLRSPSLRRALAGVRRRRPGSRRAGSRRRLADARVSTPRTRGCRSSARAPAFADGRWSFAPAGGAGALASPVVADGYVVTRRARRHGARAGGRHRERWPGRSARARRSRARRPSPMDGCSSPRWGARSWPSRSPTARSLWSTDLGGLNVSSPAIISSDLVVGAGLPQQFVVRLDGATGAIVWRTPAGHGRVQQHAAGGRGRAGGRRDQRRSLLRLRRGDRAFRAGTTAPTGSSTSPRRSSPAGASTWRAAARAIACTPSTRRRAWRSPAGRSICRRPIPIWRGRRFPRSRAVSSFASVGGLIVLETRLDDALDTDGDGLADQYLSRESAIALDPDARAPSPGSARSPGSVFTDPNDVPALRRLPHAGGVRDRRRGTPLLAVASSLVGTVSVLDAATGDDAGRPDGRGPRARLAGDGERPPHHRGRERHHRGASVEREPSADGAGPGGEPAAAGRGGRDAALVAGDGPRRRAADATSCASTPTARCWRATPSRSSRGRASTSLAVTAPLAPGVTYTFAVRARDPHGALSALVRARDVHGRDGRHGDGQRDAGGQPAERGGRRRRPGDVIVLGAGTYPLSRDAAGRAAASRAGRGGRADHHRRDGAAPSGVSFAGTDAKSPTLLDGTTVTGAATCVAVRGGATGVLLTHLVIRDCPTSGIVGGGRRRRGHRERDAGRATATGVDATGAATIKNSLADRERGRPRQRSGRATSPAATTICSGTRPTTRG